MSVYTKVGFDELNAWLSRYALSPLIELTPVASGIENTNYFVTTERERVVVVDHTKRGLAPRFRNGRPEAAENVRRGSASELELDAIERHDLLFESRRLAPLGKTNQRRHVSSALARQELADEYPSDESRGACDPRFHAEAA